jgi:hypothetical protein
MQLGPRACPSTVSAGDHVNFRFRENLHIPSYCFSEIRLARDDPWRQQANHIHDGVD